MKKTTTALGVVALAWAGTGLAEIPSDVNARRPFPDVVVQARSRQDSHGYLTDDFRFLSTPSAKLYQEGERRWKYDVNVPLRSLLPKGLKGVKPHQFRGICLALEARGDPAAAPGLAACLKMEGYHGFAVKKAADLAPLGGYGLGPEMDNCIREIGLARALWACGDHEGLAKRTLEAYAADPRGVLSTHAKAVLASRK